MAIRLSGLISGMDTDAMVQELVSAYSTKKDKYVKAQTKLEWKQDAWKELNTKIYGFYSKSLSNLRFSNAFNKKVASSSSTKAKVTASSDAVIGTQSLKVNKLAKSGYLTGAVVKNQSDSSKLKGSSKLSDLGVDKASSFQVTADGKTSNITIDANTTINQLVVKLKDAGVSANFDEANQRFFISAKKSGEAGDFKLNANSEDGVNALKALGLFTTTAADMKIYESRANMDVAAKTEEDYEKAKIASVTAEEMQARLEADNEEYAASQKALDSKNALLNFKKTYAEANWDDRKEMYDTANDRLKELNAIKKKELTDEQKAEINELKSKISDMKAVDKAIGSDTVTEEDKEKYIEEIQKSIDANDNEKQGLQDIIDRNNAILSGTADESELGYTDIEGYTAHCNDQIDEENARIKADIEKYYTDQKATAEAMVAAQQKVTQYESQATLTAAEKEDYEKALEALGREKGDGNSAVRIEGSDASITLNGAEFTSTTNSFSVNGLTIQAMAVTDPDEEITLTTDQDTQGIYNMIKDFLKEYNTLINEMDSLFNADSAKGYEPLTDDEKEAMTDKEIEKWEEKIKASLLRRDSTLDSVTTAMKSAMNATFKINGKNYSLSSFGIKTLGYFVSSDNEKGAYHIDGDSDDAATSGNADKLMKAIAADPDTVASFFNQLAENLYTQLSNKMRSSSVSSAYTVYNDKQMKKEYDNYDNIIEEWEAKIEKYEEKYRKQFTAMESAMSKMNSQQSQLSALLGVG